MPIREYTCAPKTRRWGAYVAVLGCVMLATALWTVPALLDAPYPLLWHFGAMCALTGALLVTLRRILRSYVYCLLQTEDGGFDFEVWEILGRRRICVCRVSLDCLRTLAPIVPKHRQKFTYDWSAAPRREGYVLTLSDGEETVTARFSPDREMAAMIEYSLRGGSF